MGSDFEKTMVASTPLGRIGQPDDIARIAVFLASDDSAWLTGERLAASGSATGKQRALSDGPGLPSAALVEYAAQNTKV
jgi:NAD(P)-dependent dehydrogenase (short-subunit alcohol dehydrogenase family)